MQDGRNQKKQPFYGLPVLTKRGIPRMDSGGSVYASGEWFPEGDLHYLFCVIIISDNLMNLKQFIPVFLTV